MCEIYGVGRQMYEHWYDLFANDLKSDLHQMNKINACWQPDKTISYGKGLISLFLIGKKYQ